MHFVPSTSSNNLSISIMKASHVPSLGAFHKDSGQYVSPTHASKQNAYVCPTCSKDLIFCKGAVRIPYFRHAASSNPCNYYTHPGESDFHKDAKYRMKELLLQRTPLTFLRTCKTCTKHEEYVLDPSEVLESATVALEYSFTYLGQRKQADVAIIDGPDDNAPISFEIRHSHATCEEDRPDPWFEVDALTLIQLTNKSSFDRRIPCMRSLEICDACMDAKNAKIIAKCQTMESLRTVPKNDLDLEHYIRYKLGQRDFNQCRKVELYGGQYEIPHDIETTVYPFGVHAKFDRDANDDDVRNAYNDSLMNRFSQFMGKLYIISYSHEGGLWYEIIDKSNYSNEYRYTKEFCEQNDDWYGCGTVEIIKDALCYIRDNYADCIGNGGCFMSCLCKYAKKECTCIDGYYKKYECVYDCELVHCAICKKKYPKRDAVLDNSCDRKNDIHRMKQTDRICFACITVRSERDAHRLDEEFNKKRMAARAKWKGKILKLVNYDFDTVYLDIPYKNMDIIKRDSVREYMTWNPEIKLWSIPLREYRENYSRLFKIYTNGEVVVEEAPDGIKTQKQVIGSVQRRRLFC